MDDKNEKLTNQTESEESEVKNPEVENSDATNSKAANSKVKNSELMDIQHLPKKHKLFSPVTIFTIVTGLILLGCFYLYFVLNYVSPINTALRVSDIKVTNDTYDLVKTTLEKRNKEITDDEVCIFLSDTIILSEKAKELGITAKESEYKSLIDEYGDMSERIVLRNKLNDYLEENASVTEEEMKTFYENAKTEYYYDPDSKFKYYAIQSDSPMPDNYTPNGNSNLQLKEGTLKQLRAYGIYEPTKGIFQIESTEDGIYKYIIITDGEIEYLPYEQVKDSIKNALYIQKTEGQINEFIKNGRTIYDIRYFK